MLRAYSSGGEMLRSISEPPAALIGQRTVAAVLAVDAGATSAGGGMGTISG